MNRRLSALTQGRPGFVFGLLAVVLLTNPIVACAADSLLDLKVTTDRLFGHSLGDLIHKKISFRLEHPQRLQKSALPQPGPIDQSIDLRRIEIREEILKQSTEFTITLHYQIFPALQKPGVLKIPGLSIPIVDAEKIREQSTPDTILSINPLIPPGTPDNQVILREAYAPEPIALDRHWRRIGLLGFCVLAGLGYFAYRRGLLFFRNSNRSPFGYARRQIAKWKKADENSPEYRKALLLVHTALNQTAGETLYVNGLENFFRAHPRFAALQEKTHAFFNVSEQVFFTGIQEPQGRGISIQWLEQLCREYHAIERNS